MEGLLLNPPPPVTAPLDLTSQLESLFQEVATLRAEVARLRRENIDLRQQANYYQAQHARAVRRAEELKQEVEHLRGENRKLQAQIFGRKSETGSGPDRSNDLN